MNESNGVLRDARKLGIPKMLILGLQHMFAMFGATILVPILVNSYFVDACGEGPSRGLTVSVTLFCAGFGTLLFHLCAKFKVPAFLGSSFAFLSGFAAVANLNTGKYASMSVNDKAAYACGGIVVAGLSDVSVRFSKCCSPVPGDEIIGFVTRGRGVSIHRTDCVNMMNLSEADRQRIIEAEWSVDSQGSADEDYDAEIVIYAYDRMGILMDITRVLTENKIDVKAMNTRTSKQGIATINVSFAIRGVEALNELIKKLRNVPNVTDIERSRA